jgi:hypothetical protein
MLTRADPRAILTAAVTATSPHTDPQRESGQPQIAESSRRTSQMGRADKEEVARHGSSHLHRKLTLLRYSRVAWAGDQAVPVVDEGAQGRGRGLDAVGSMGGYRSCGQRLRLFRIHADGLGPYEPLRWDV